MNESATPAPEARSGAGLAALGLPLGALAALALVASLFGRLIAPALLGAATGIERWIQVAQATANLTSPAVALFAVVFTLRAVGMTLAKSALGVAYRLIAVPAALAACALVVAALGRVLEPSLASALALSALVTAALGVPLALRAPTTRALGLILALTTIAAALDFAGTRLSLAAVERVSEAQYRTATMLSTAGFAFEVILVAVAFAAVAGRRSGRATALMAASIALTALVAYLVNAGTSAEATTFEVVVARAVAELLRAPAPMVPAAARLTLEVAGLVAAVSALVAVRRAPHASLIALCLVARGAVDVPIPALLLVVAALTTPAYGAPEPVTQPG